MSHNKAILFLVMAALLWSSGGLLVKWVDAHPLAIAGWRSAIGFVFILGWTKRIDFRPSAATLVGGVCYAGTVTLFVIATKMTTAANAILLQYTAPIYVAILSRLVLRELPTKLDWLTMLLMSIGMILFFLDKVSATGLLGNVAGVFSGIFFGGFILAMRKQANASPIQSVLYGNLIAALVALPFFFKITLSAESIGGLATLGVFQLALPYILYSIAIKHITAIESSLILVLEPILNPVWVFLLNGEIPAKFALIGSTMVIGALLARAALTKRLTKA
jgi:drug/metabolite transporter (DMT)-like permease